MWGRVALHSKGDHGCILAHSMGLGKTLSVVALVNAFARKQASANLKFQAVIVCPVSNVSSSMVMSLLLTRLGKAVPRHLRVYGVLPVQG